MNKQSRSKKVQATIKLLANNTPKITITLDQYDIDELMLLEGIQPDGIFRIQVNKKKFKI